LQIGRRRAGELIAHVDDRAHRRPRHARGLGEDHHALGAGFDHHVLGDKHWHVGTVDSSEQLTAWTASI